MSDEFHKEKAQLATDHAHELNLLNGKAENIMMNFSKTEQSKQEVEVRLREQLQCLKQNVEMKDKRLQEMEQRIFATDEENA